MSEDRLHIPCEEVVGAQAKTMQAHSKEVAFLRRVIHTLKQQLIGAGIKPLVEFNDGSNA